MVFVITAIMATLAVPLPLQARPMQAKNSHILLDLPDDFIPHRRQAGFMSVRRGATVMVLDLPRSAYEQFANGFEQVLARKGYVDVRREQLAGRSDDHLFFRARRDTPIGLLDKYLLIFHDASHTAYVTITIKPRQGGGPGLGDDDARRILVRASIAGGMATAATGYDLDYVGPFRRRGKVAGSTSIYSLPADMETAGSGAGIRPLFIISPSLSRRQIGDLAHTAQEMMKKIEHFRNVHLEAEEYRVVDGMPAYGLSAHAASRSGQGKKVGLYQMVIKRPKGGYFRLLGMAPADQFGRYLNQFRHMAASFHLTPDSVAAGY